VNLVRRVNLVNLDPCYAPPLPVPLFGHDAAVDPDTGDVLLAGLAEVSNPAVGAVRGRVAATLVASDAALAEPAQFFQDLPDGFRLALSLKSNRFVHSPDGRPAGLVPTSGPYSRGQGSTPEGHPLRSCLPGSGCKPIPPHSRTGSGREGVKKEEL
jgi:hypothetical protein